MNRNAPAVVSETVTLADLSERQAAFVHEYVERGGRPGAGTAAVLAAGLTKNRAAARVRATELLRHPKVLQFLRDELTRKLNAGAVLGVQTLTDLCQNARSEQVRFSAARELVDRGYGPVVSRSATIHASTSIEDWLKRLADRDAAGARAKVIEGEVVEGASVAPRGDEGV
jgi:phage terminase small subunit